MLCFTPTFSLQGTCKHTQPCQMGMVSHALNQIVSMVVPAICAPGPACTHCARPVQLLARPQSDLAWLPDRPLNGFPVLLRELVICSTADAGLPCHIAASLTPTLGASFALSSLDCTVALQQCPQRPDFQLACMLLLATVSGVLSPLASQSHSAATSG